jgi:hypothetical protein
MATSLQLVLDPSTGQLLFLPIPAGGGGTPGGADQSIQFNNAGSFDGFGSWDGTTLTVPGNVNPVTISGTSSEDTAVSYKGSEFSGANWSEGPTGTWTHTPGSDESLYCSLSGYTEGSVVSLHYDATLLAGNFSVALGGSFTINYGSIGSGSAVFNVLIPPGIGGSAYIEFRPTSDYDGVISGINVYKIPDIIDWTGVTAGNFSTGLYNLLPNGYASGPLVSLNLVGVEGYDNTGSYLISMSPLGGLSSQWSGNSGEYKLISFIANIFNDVGYQLQTYDGVNTYNASSTLSTVGQLNNSGALGYSFDNAIFSNQNIPATASLIQSNNLDTDPTSHAVVGAITAGIGAKAMFNFNTPSHAASLYLDDTTGLVGFAPDGSSAPVVTFNQTTGAFVSAGLAYPTSDAAAGYVMTTDGAGTLSLQPPGGSGSPGGADTSIQFNNGGSFGGFGFWDGSTVSLAPTGIADGYFSLTPNNANTTPAGNQGPAIEFGTGDFGGLFFVQAPNPATVGGFVSFTAPNVDYTKYASFQAIGDAGSNNPQFEFQVADGGNPAILQMDKGFDSTISFYSFDNGFTTIASLGNSSNPWANVYSSNYIVNGHAGASGTGTVISSITVENGIITAITVA